MATTLFMRLGKAAPSGFTLPAGYWSSSWSSNSNPAKGGANACALDPLPGSSQVSSSFAVNTGSIDYGLAQFFSAPLTAQTIAAGSWIAGLGIGRGVGISYEPVLFIGVMRGNGSGLRGTIVTTDAVGASRATTAETTGWNNGISGSAVTAVAGDVLVVEFAVFNNSSFADTVTLYADGTTAITADGASTSDAEAFITCPQTLVFNNLLFTAADSRLLADGLLHTGKTVPAVSQIIKDSQTHTTLPVPQAAIKIQDSTTVTGLRNVVAALRVTQLTTFMMIISFNAANILLATGVTNQVDLAATADLDKVVDSGIRLSLQTAVNLQKLTATPTRMGIPASSDRILVTSLGSIIYIRTAADLLRVTTVGIPLGVPGPRDHVSGIKDAEARLGLATPHEFTQMGILQDHAHGQVTYYFVSQEQLHLLAATILIGQPGIRNPLTLTTILGQVIQLPFSEVPTLQGHLATLAKLPLAVAENLVALSRILGQLPLTGNLIPVSGNTILGTPAPAMAVHTIDRQQESGIPIPHNHTTPLGVETTQTPRAAQARLVIQSVAVPLGNPIPAAGIRIRDAQSGVGLMQPVTGIRMQDVGSLLGALLFMALDKLTAKDSTLVLGRPSPHDRASSQDQVTWLLALAAHDRLQILATGSLQPAAGALDRVTLAAALNTLAGFRIPDTLQPDDQILFYVVGSGSRALATLAVQPGPTAALQVLLFAADGN